MLHFSHQAHHPASPVRCSSSPSMSSRNAARQAQELSTFAVPGSASNDPQRYTRPTGTPSGSRSDERRDAVQRPIHELWPPTPTSVKSSPACHRASRSRRPRNDDDRAVRVRRTRTADRAQDKSRKTTPPSRANDDHTGVLRTLDQSLCRLRESGAQGHLDVRVTLDQPTSSGHQISTHPCRHFLE